MKYLDEIDKQIDKIAHTLFGQIIPALVIVGFIISVISVILRLLLIQD